MRRIKKMKAEFEFDVSKNSNPTIRIKAETEMESYALRKICEESKGDLISRIVIQTSLEEQQNENL
jgi:hypothetical protein